MEKYTIEDSDESETNNDNKILNHDKTHVLKDADIELDIDVDIDADIDADADDDADINTDADDDDLEIRLNRIEKKINLIYNILCKDVKPSNENMNKHIQFIENTYDKLKKPINYVSETINSYMIRDKEELGEDDYNDKRLLKQ